MTEEGRGGEETDVAAAVRTGLLLMQVQTRRLKRGVRGAGPDSRRQNAESRQSYVQINSREGDRGLNPAQLLAG